MIKSLNFLTKSTSEMSMTFGYQIVGRALKSDYLIKNDENDNEDVITFKTFIMISDVSLKDVCQLRPMMHV